MRLLFGRDLLSLRSGSSESSDTRGEEDDMSTEAFAGVQWVLARNVDLEMRKPGLVLVLMAGEGKASRNFL